jgi:hypothetical protein
LPRDHRAVRVTLVVSNAYLAVEFAIGLQPSARYVMKLISRPGATVPQLGLFRQGDFKGTIDWTSEKAQSRPQLDIKGSVLVSVEGRF